MTGIPDHRFGPVSLPVNGLDGECHSTLVIYLFVAFLVSHLTLYAPLEALPFLGAVDPNF